MKFSLIAVTFALVASAMAQNSTVVPNGMGGTAATASISVNGTDAHKNAGTQLNGGIIAITLTSTVAAAYALL
ncbi:unnamed protein product [Mucor hiemalis]